MSPMTFDTASSAAIRRLLEALLAAPRVVVISHEHPDGDALGSALALVAFLRNAGRDAIAAGIEPLPDSLGFLSISARDFLVPSADFEPHPGDLVCFVDCNGIHRIPESLRPSVSGASAFACIDHHLSDSYPSSAVYAIPDASSTAELVWNLAQAAGWSTTPLIADALWTGIVTDTGRFSYPCTRPSTLRCAAALLESGARAPLVADECFHLVPLRRLRLQRRLLDSLELHAGGRAAIATLSPDDYAAEDASSADSENFVNIPRFLRGVEAAVLLYSTTPGIVNLSMRTVAPLDAAAFCARFGGGGHARAAGATVHRPLPEVRAAVLDLLVPFVAPKAIVSQSAPEPVP